MAAKTPSSGPLSGVRVADFSVHAAGPFAGLMLAELGAQVIKVESSARLDITRRPHTMYGKPPSSFEQVNANKLSVCLNLKEPQAVELALQLVRLSDLVLENFRPGVMDRLGLGYEYLRRVRPDIILISISSNGQTGPERGYAGYAPMFSALGGLGHLTGYPDGPPVELRHAMDHTGGMMAALVALAALCGKSPLAKGAQGPVSKEGTGGMSAGTTPEYNEGEPWRDSLGIHVDVSVRDVATAFIGPELLDYAMNQREPMRRGNRDDAAAPQGVYRCHGEDDWVSVSVASQEEWQGLCRAMGQPSWCRQDKFGDGYQRWQNQDELDRHLEEWTLSLSPVEVTQRLQAEGVAAFPSLSAADLMADRHLHDRNAFPEVHHPEKGRQRAVAPPWRFSKTPARIDQWTPDLGEHNLEVFHGLLGLGVDQVRSLEHAKVIW